MDSEAVVLIFHHFQTYNPIYFVNLRIMKLVIQRVIEASVSIGGELHSTIGQGLMVLVGVAEGDTPDDVRWLASKCVAMRIFSDNAGVMNRSLADVDGELLAVSQFTLCASTRKGNRPSYIHGLPATTLQSLSTKCFATNALRFLEKKLKRGCLGLTCRCHL